MINGNSSWKADHFSVYPVRSSEIKKAGEKENSRKAPPRKLGWSDSILSNLAIKPNLRKELKFGPECICLLETGHDFCTKLCRKLARLLVENKILTR